MEASPSVKSAERALELLEVVSTYPDGATFAELEKRLRYPRSSLHGLLGTVAGRGWLSYDPESRTYAVGVRPWQVGQAFRRSRDLVVAARPYLLDASSRLGETIQLGILDGFDVVYIDKVDGVHPLRLVSQVGSRLPAYVTGIGKALLTGLSDSALHEAFAGRSLDEYTTRTISSGDRLLEVIQQVRAEGYATDDGEYTAGVYCVAVPIIAANGEVVAAVSCSVPEARIASHELERNLMKTVLRDTATGIASSLR